MASSSVTRSPATRSKRSAPGAQGPARMEGAVEVEVAARPAAKSRKAAASLQASGTPPEGKSPAAAVAAPATRARSAGRALHKGQQTKATIVEAALNLATHIGLEGLSIGAIAELTGMSKSGVFAHFGSREELQISVVHEYHDRFEQEVFYPAITAPRGIPRLRALFDNWMKRTSIEIDSGCIYISGAVEFDDRTGPVRDALVESVSTWHAAMRRTIVQSKECGDLRADVDESQLLFEIHGLILALHYEARFLRSEGSIERAQAAFNNILARYAREPFSA